MNMKSGKKDYTPRKQTKAEEQDCAAQLRMNLLDSKISQGSQDYTLTQLYKATYKGGNDVVVWIRTEKLRITIKSDSYAAQCHARISIYSPEEKKWNRLASIEHGVMQTASGLNHRQDAPTEYNFQHDISELMRLAYLILA